MKKKKKKKKALKMTNSLVIFRAFFIFFFVPSTLNLENNSRKSANKKILALALWQVHSDPLKRLS